MANFDRKIEARWPDPDGPEGWMVVRLECGHLTYQPQSNTNTICHCGVCMLDHEAHVREVARIQKEQEKLQQPKEATAHG